VDALKSATEQLRNVARSAGRNPAELKIIVRQNLQITPEPLSGDRNFFSGSIGQIEEDIKAVKMFEPDELILDVTFSPDSQNEEGFLRNLERLRSFI
jgi:hypothetical protein